ncbi:MULTISPECIES: glycine zipper 2TM domain-containing protein [unclassified Duganella]|uniref:glycine zipper 2TM domain-containing protein n=1 Tax=unclassified Duganella TaxID=2636909 RepID=UPI000E3515CA|nr:MULTISPECIES: glycine zipper 2TM domain-containing protein [unclassified Duganella]RFP11478.1 glycine zipper 2TM domain-containing protein [Duganella sp. BJB475]RFP29798.1 glycine zipper 2TM domain-containing protein [Duganella sp. BJB476]
MTTTPTTRIHPLMAVAAVSLTLVSLVGAASIAGLLPSSHATPDTTPVVANSAPQAGQSLAAQPAQETRQPVMEHRTVHHVTPQVRRVDSNGDSVQAPVAQAPAPAPAPVAQNSPLGMGIGAVVGGLIGNQVGGGKGKTAATIAGVVGGAYVGNEIAKKN